MAGSMGNVKRAPAPRPGVCPTCGQEISPNRLLVDLTTNSVVYKFKYITLRPREAEVLAVLNEAWPGNVPTQQIMYRVYGAEQLPHSTAVINVYIYQLRQRLRPLGVTIVCNYFRHGYRLVMPHQHGR